MTYLWGGCYTRQASRQFRRALVLFWEAYMSKLRNVGKFLLAAFCFFFMTATNCYAGWHELTQAERDQRILTQARLYYDGQYLGSPAGECKIWVTEVVRKAALAEGTDLTLGGTQQSLPLTQSSPADYLWYARSDVSGVTGISLSSLTPGQIIQLRVWYRLDHSTGFGPHTLIVTSNDTVNRVLNVIESNWTAPFAVYRRSVSYTTFNQYLVFSGSYTVYWPH